jgi:glycosyltransferase involved in cell wall biosynthesis
MDDAIWLGSERARRAVTSIVGRADVVFAGNEFIADWVDSSGGEPVLVPTVVDVSKYPALPPEVEDGTLRVGWIGTASNFLFLDLVRDQLRSLVASSTLMMTIVCDRPYPEPGFGFQPWHPEAEYELGSQFDVGLMPLGADEWSEGKCGLKALQYAAAWLPSLSSPTRFTETLDRLGITTVAHNVNDWTDQLMNLAENRDELVRRRGVARRALEARYDLEHAADIISSELRRLCR